MRDSFVQAVAPALPLVELLQQGPTLGRKLRERNRKREGQMSQLVALIKHDSY